MLDDFVAKQNTNTYLIASTPSFAWLRQAHRSHKSHLSHILFFLLPNPRQKSLPQSSSASAHAQLIFHTRACQFLPTAVSFIGYWLFLVGYWIFILFHNSYLLIQGLFDLHLLKQLLTTCRNPDCS